MKTRIPLFLTTIFAAAASIFSQTPPAQTVSSAGYMLGPGDVISIKALGEPSFDVEALTVDEDGRILIPYVDAPIVAKCKTERGLQAEVVQAWSKYLRKPQISLRVTQRNSRPPVSVSGEVRTPQLVVLTRKTSLLEVLAFSGGVTDDAMGLIQIFRTRNPVCAEEDQENVWTAEAKTGLDVPSRLFSLSGLRDGKEEANPTVLPGDVVVVQKAAPVYITGEVLAPQGLYLKEGGLSLSEAVAKIGGVRREAKTKDIKIYRLKPDSKDREIIAVNYELIRKGDQKDVMLQPYDIVEVDKAKESIAMTILKIATGTAKQAVGGFGTALPSRVLY